MSVSRELEQQILQELKEDPFNVENVLTLVELHCSRQAGKYRDSATSGDKYQDFGYWSTYAQGITDLKTKLQNYIPPSIEQ